MKRVITVLIMLNISTVLCSQDILCSQDTIKIDYYPASFIGTWIGTVGDKSYEFELQRQIVSADAKHNDGYIELVLGSIKYLEKGKAVRVIPVEKFHAPLIGRKYSAGKTNSDTTAIFSYSDREKGLRGNVYLTLESHDKNTVKWKLGPGEWSSEKEKNFDLPREMVLKRKKK
jgi:hypothetical protein